MAKNKIYTVPYKRKREGKTDYRKRLRLLTSHRMRLAVRRTSNKIEIQAINFTEKGDKIIGVISSTELKDYGWEAATGNIPSAYLTGYLFAKKFGSKVKDPVIDLGFKTITDRSRLSATIKGLSDGGIKLNFNERIIPKEEDLNGNTISKYAQEIAKDTERYNKQFSAYVKRKIKPEDLPKLFNSTKNKIEEKWQKE